MRILFSVAQSKDGLKAAEVVAATGLPRQACYHLLHTLVATGILTRSGPGKYVLGLRVGTLIEGFKRQLAPPEHLAPVVRRIAEETGETAYASGWWAGEIAVFQQDGGTYRRLASVATPTGARTSLFEPDLDRLFVAVRAGLLGSDASIQVFRPLP
jgi:DNA-binding IclR family transcriptional regulator